jgi:hypothetical protein
VQRLAGLQRGQRDAERDVESEAQFVGGPPGGCLPKHIVTHAADALLARAQRAEVLRRLGRDVREQLRGRESARGMAHASTTAPARRDSTTRESSPIKLEAAVVHGAGRVGRHRSAGALRPTENRRSDAPSSRCGPPGRRRWRHRKRPSGSASWQGGGLRCEGRVRQQRVASARASTTGRSHACATRQEGRRD